MSIRGLLSQDVDLEFLFRLSRVLGTLVVILVGCYFVFRYTYLTGYSKETKPQEGNGPMAKPTQKPVNVGPKKLRIKRTLNYLDEFLAAIKVFGYLEPPVFHELTKNMTTQKLGEDEVLYLDEQVGFSIVVDGVLQVYTQAPNLDDIAYEEDEVVTVGNQRYQLLNEVKQGATLSPLVSTLDLFQTQSTTPGFPFPLAPPSPGLAASPDLGPTLLLPKYVAKARTKPHHTSATIAIIPRLAFVRIQTLYPKATSHIVTMVLTRLYKVTMLTIHNYLGLTREIMDAEIRLNSRLSDQRVLPLYLYLGLVERLATNDDHRFVPTRTQKPPVPAPLLRQLLKYVVLDLSRDKSLFLGDLLSSVPLLLKPEMTAPKRRGLVGLLPPLEASLALRLEDLHKGYFGSDDETEERAFKWAVVDAIFDRLGVTRETLTKPRDYLSSQTLLRSSLVFDLALTSLMDTPTTVYPTGYLRSKFEEKPLPQPEEFSEDKWRKMRQKWAEHLQIKYVAPEKVLVKQDSFDTGLYYVIDGKVDIVQEGQTTTLYHNKRKVLYSVNAGGLAGYVSIVVGFRLMVTIQTGSEGALVALISRENYFKLMDKYYMLQLPVAVKLKLLLLANFLTIDYALEWCHIPAGQYLCTEGDIANGFHVVLSGRFRVTKLRDEGQAEVIGEYGHGELIGEVEVLTKSRRTASLVAVRDLETARIPRTLFEIILVVHPSIMVKVLRIVAQKLLNLEKQIEIDAFSNTTATISCDYKTITIMPTTLGIPVLQFADKLVASLKAIGRHVIALDQALALTQLGRHAFDERLAELKLSGYFAYLEEEYDHVVYVCDLTLKSNWTHTCILQGDCILLIADADDDYTAANIGEYERALLNMKTTARADLCLLHPEKYVAPGHTQKWLKPRHWVTNHHHIHMVIPVRPSKKKQKLVIGEFAVKLSRRNALELVKLKAINSFAKFKGITTPTEPFIAPGTASHKDDFMRLARILANEAVGLVLGGGGARGISHVGVVTALEKHGIPVDMIGGTLIGLFVGGLYAKDYDAVLIYGRCKQFSRRILALWRMALDLTYPVTSYTTGYEFNRGIWKIFGNYKIEDFWLSYFCNLTNITNSTMDIHEDGYSWRFIRALMSLAGLLPPIAYKGCMLLDGGYLDNLPVMEMKKKGAKHIIAVDVGSVDDRTPQNYGDTLLGFWVILNRWNPFSKYPNVPNMADIQLRLAYVASVRALELAKHTAGVIYLRPPIEDFATLDFGKFEEIYHLGRNYAEETLLELERAGQLPRIVTKVPLAASGERTPLQRRNLV